MPGGADRIHLVEGRPGGGVFLGHVTASDPDEGDGGRVDCRLDDDVDDENIKDSFQLVKLQFNDLTTSSVGYQLVTTDQVRAF